MSGAILEAKVLITGVDHVTPELEAIAKKIEAISRMGREVGKASSSVSGIASASDLLSRATEVERAVAVVSEAFASGAAKMMRIASEVGRSSETLGAAAQTVRRRQREDRHGFLHRFGHDAGHAWREVAPFAAGGAFIETIHGIKDAVKGGAEIQSERARMGVAGIPAAEIAAADSQAAALAARYPNVTHAQILENYRETRSVLLDPAETPAMMPTIVATRSAMDALDPSGKSSEGLKYAIKGAEILGKTRDPAQLKQYFDSFVRAQQVMGSTVDPEQLGDFAKYARSSGQLLSNRFLNTTANSFIQEEKGSTAGKMVNDFVKEMTGSFAGQHEAAKEMVALGLAKTSDFDHTKTGEIKGLKHGHHIQGWDLAASDPDRFVWEKLIPAMAAHGITDPQAQVAEMRRLFPNSLAADFGSKLLLQEAAFQNHSKLYGEAAGIAGGESLLQNDPTAALGSLSHSLETFGATLASPIMQDAAKGMSAVSASVAGWSNSLAQWQKAHPEAAKWAAGGAIGGGLMAGGALGVTAWTGLSSGFGLKGSATALDQSAGKLSAAAAKLGGTASSGSLASAERDAAGSFGGINLTARSVILTANLLSLIANLPDPTPVKTPEQRDQADRDAKAWWKKNGDPIGWLWGHAKSAAHYIGDSIIPSAHAEGAHGSPYGALNADHALFAPLSSLGSNLAAALSGKIEANVKPDQITAKLVGKLEPGVLVIKLEAPPGFKVTGPTTAIVRANVGTSMPEAGPLGPNGTGRQ